MRYETQADLLRLLELLARHFTSSVFSLRVTRSFDAARIVTMACIATLSDCILRKVASDVPSQFSLHFSGEAEGPVSAYGFEMGYFLEESGFLSVPDAFICTARTQILDYFTQQKKFIVDDDHIIFRFERDMSFGQGEKNLMDQLCVQMGFVRGSQELPMYLTGENPLIVDNYPELALFRDTVFLFKALLAPSSGDLPELRPWFATDARLFWRVAKTEVRDKNDSSRLIREASFDVSGFGKKRMKCAAFQKTYDELGGVEKEKKGFLRSFLGVFGFGKSKPRAPPSGANPSNLVKGTVHTEDDVLHIRNLPDFGGRLRARDCELLVQYLTVPYLRIPLVLQFFAETSAHHPRSQVRI